MPHRPDLDHLDIGESISSLKPGEWCFDDDGILIFRTPNDQLGRISPKGGWTLTGPREALTVSPSIHVWTQWGKENRRITLWHGFLRGGRWETCPDTPDPLVLPDPDLDE